MSFDFNNALELSAPILEFNETLSPSDRLRLAAYLLSLVDSIQQDNAVPREMEGFGDNSRDDLAFQYHNALEDLADTFDDLATAMDEKETKDNLKKVALSKLTREEQEALGVC